MSQSNDKVNICAMERHIYVMVWTSKVKSLKTRISTEQIRKFDAKIKTLL